MGLKVYNQEEPIAVIIYKTSWLFGLFSWWTCEFFWDWGSTDKRDRELRKTCSPVLFAMTYQKVKNVNNRTQG